MVIHQPGSMNKNLCVIEVKSSYNAIGIIKDFNTLKCMLKCYDYIFGMYIYIGEDTLFFREKIVPLLDLDGLSGLEDRIYILCMKSKKI